MSISSVIMLGLPVLYVTGSLRKSTGAAGIGGACFVLYFIIGILLSLIPPLSVSGGFSVCLSGAFMCIAPFVYLLVLKDLTFRFYLSAMITVLVSVTASFLDITYTISVLSVGLIFAVSVIAVLFMKRKAPLYAPVLIGIYSVSADIMALLTETVRSVTVFDVADIVCLCFVICLAVSYLLSRPWHKMPLAQT